MDRILPQRQIAGMERASNLKLALYALVIAAVLVAVVSLLSWGLNLWSAAELACQMSKSKDPMDIGKANGCLEFWANRYQSLIGNVLTAIVAGATLLLLIRQLAPAHRQASVAAAQALRVLGEDLTKERETYQDFIRTVSGLRSFFPPDPFGRAPFEHWERYYLRCNKISGGIELIRMQADLLYLENTATPRGPVLEKLIAEAVSIRQVTQAALNEERKRPRESKPSSDTIAQYAADDPKVTAALDRVHWLLQDLEISTVQDIAATAAQVRRFELRAVHG